MFLHPSSQIEIARQRQRDLLAWGERQRIAKAALAGRQGDRVRRPVEPAARHEPLPPTTVRRPQEAKA